MPSPSSLPAGTKWSFRVPYVGFSPTGLVWLETSTDSSYNLPFQKGILTGWQVAAVAVAVARTGTPISILDTSGAAFVRAGNLWGDSGRNIDFSVNKSFALAERMALEWRSEFFNLLNITNFTNPGASITAVTYGVIRSTTGNPRVIQFALKLTF